MTTHDALLKRARQQLSEVYFPGRDGPYETISALIEAVEALQRERVEAVKALQYARPLLVKYAHTQGNRADFVREITKPVDAALSAIRSKED